MLTQLPTSTGESDPVQSQIQPHHLAYLSEGCADMAAA
jgi:hypothetical protein